MMGDVEKWIQKPCPDFLWLGTYKFGDPTLKHNWYLFLEKSMIVSPYNRGITIKSIGVPYSQRRQGKATAMLDMIEKTAKECGLQFVMIEAVCSEEMTALIGKRGGYELVNQLFKHWDYIKIL
jgi:hypothetical protein